MDDAGLSVHALPFLLRQGVLWLKKGRGFQQQPSQWVSVLDLPRLLSMAALLSTFLLFQLPWQSSVFPHKTFTVQGHQD